MESHLSSNLCCFTSFCNGSVSVVKHSLYPFLRDFSNLFIHFLLGKVIFHVTEKVCNCIILASLIFEREIVIRQIGYPPVSHSIKVS